MKIRERIKAMCDRVTGVSTPVGGVSWSPSDRDARVDEVVDRYLSVPSRDRTTNLIDFVKTGGALLPDAAAILEANEKIELRGGCSLFIFNMRERVGEEEWLSFFRWYATRRDNISDVFNEIKINEMLDQFRAHMDAEQAPRPVP